MSATSQSTLRRPLKALAALLSYPGAALTAHLDEIAEVLVMRAELAPADRRALEAFLAWLRDTDLLEVQATFVETFDRSKKVSLYLFEHLYGESRSRGPAMVELGMAYREHGLELASNELPDYLPLFLEFCAELPDAEAIAWLAEPAQVLQQVHVRLVDRASPFAAPLGVLLRLFGADPMPRELVESAAGEERDDTPEALDRSWVEAPVTFGPNQPGTGCGAMAQSHERPARPPARG